MERLARRGRRLIFVLTLAACGGGRTETKEPARALPDAAVPDAFVADAAPPDLCGGYGLAIRPSLGRMARAADVFLQKPDAKGAITLADALDAELPKLKTIATGDASLDAAHARIVAAVVELSAAVRALAVKADDAARATLSEKLRVWAEAVQAVIAICPDLSR